MVFRASFFVGLHCLAAWALAVAAAPCRVKRNMPAPIPTALLDPLAAARSLHGQGAGHGLVRDAVLRALQASGVLAVRRLLVQALNHDDKRFCQSCGFTPSPTERLMLRTTPGALTDPRRSHPRQGRYNQPARPAP